MTSFESLKADLEALEDRVLTAECELEEERDRLQRAIEDVSVAADKLADDIRRVYGHSPLPDKHTVDRLLLRDLFNAISNAGALV